MKKVMTMALLAVLILGACEKEDTQTATRQQKHNRVVALPSDGKTGDSFLLQMCIGHDGKNCNGCVCATSAAVQFQINGPVFSATTTDTFDLTSEDFFLMPDRSLDYMDDKGNPIYLNIPGQMVYRDSTTLQFTFTGLFFSEGPAYEND